MKKPAVFFCLLLSFTLLKGQVDTSRRNMTDREKELYKLMMEYRKKKKLDAIDLSPSLTKVAQIHVRDLNENTPSEKCGMHSWSENGPWKPVCYDKSGKGPELMWSKPSELSDYTGNGYEIAFWTTDTSFTADEALAAWKSSPAHNAVIINLGMWKSSDWKAIGVAAEGSYSVVWFGEESDPEGILDEKE